MKSYSRPHLDNFYISLPVWPPFRAAQLHRTWRPCKASGMVFFFSTISWASCTTLHNRYVIMEELRKLWLWHMHSTTSLWKLDYVIGLKKRTIKVEVEYIDYTVVCLWFKFKRSFNQVTNVRQRIQRLTLSLRSFSEASVYLLPDIEQKKQIHNLLIYL